MRVAVLGTGVVGRTLAGELARRGDDVAVGTREPTRTRQANEELSLLLAEHPTITLKSFNAAVLDADLVIVAVGGTHALDAIADADPAALSGRLVLDVSNPLDFTDGFPPTLSISNTSSLGEQIQAAAPGALVVKALNTVNVGVMVEPGKVGAGEHDLLICGNDVDAKRQVLEFLQTRFGWRHAIDLGDITNARGTEMYLALWTRLLGALGTADFNVRVVR
jgi:8-hydroxy-5-deazaflavin:NADPH oxidoreductase